MFSNSTLVLAIYLACFATIHSLLAGLWLKDRARQAFGTRAMRWYRLFYSILAAATLFPLMYLLYKFPGEVIYIVPSPWRWIMIFGQLLATLAFGKAFLEAGPLRFLGIRSDDGRSELIVQGIRCRVRNPLFLFALIFLWLTPAMTDNLLVLYLLATVYFYLGSIHEEKMLTEEFGDAYRDYQKRVPRIVPRLSCRYPETGIEARRGPPPGSRAEGERAAKGHRHRP